MINNTPGLVYGCSARLVLNISVAETANVNLKTKPLQVQIKKEMKNPFLQE